MANKLEWQYRVQTVGSRWRRTRDDVLEALLNDWTAEGWVIVSTFSPYGSGKVTIVARRALSPAEGRRRRSLEVSDLG